MTASVVRSRWFFVAAFLAVAAVFASFYFDADTRTWIAAQQNPALRKFLRAVSQIGDWPAHVALGAMLAGLAFWRGHQKWTRIFLAMLVACALAGIAARVMKISTGRARPSVQTETSWNGPRWSSKYNAFPSGHTAASTAFFCTLAFACWRVGLATLAVPALIAFSRMYVAAHFLSDVVCAALLGAICAWIAWSLMLRRQLRAPAVAD